MTWGPIGPKRFLNLIVPDFSAVSDSRFWILRFWRLDVHFLAVEGCHPWVLPRNGWMSGRTVETVSKYIEYIVSREQTSLKMFKDVRTLVNKNQQHACLQLQWVEDVMTRWRYKDTLQINMYNERLQIIFALEPHAHAICLSSFLQIKLPLPYLIVVHHGGCVKLVTISDSQMICDYFHWYFLSQFKGHRTFGMS